MEIIYFMKKILHQFQNANSLSTNYYKNILEKAKEKESVDLKNNTWYFLVLLLYIV